MQNDGTTSTPKVLKWSDIDKMKFYSIGTVMYSALTVMLHPISVLKTRQQVLSSAAIATNNSRQLQPSFQSTIRDAIRSSSGIRGLFRGLGIVIAMAVPARMIYIGVLESGRQEIGSGLNRLVLQFYEGGPNGIVKEESNLNSNSNINIILPPQPLLASVSGGLAGGLAAVSAQILVVPMDVISQKQMVTKDGMTARAVVQSVLRTDGWRGLYRGFALSVCNSLPAGTVWWATYSGCQHWIQPYILKIPSFSGNNDHLHAPTSLLQQGVTQVFAGSTAAVVAAVTTQPLDVVKTRLQVGTTVGACTSASSSPLAIAKELFATSGVRGFFWGLGPRTLHIGLWGTVLSSAYEVLRHVSRKDDR